MHISKNIEIIDLALYLEKESTLVLGDLHIGYEEFLNKEGVLIPRFQLEDLVKKINNILDRVNPKKIIINGDLKHEFGTISQQEWNDTMKILDLFNNKEIILIKGNHDSILEPIAKKKNIKIKDYFSVNDIYICHGNKIPDDQDFKKSKILIMGHEHPSITFKERKDEKYKCFLKGKWKNKLLIVMPSMNLVTQGSDITKEKLLSPFLQQNIENFEVFAVENKIYDFGKLKDLI
ncbi:MAG: metallophosphoesterase [Nanoarchaeota archaeon]|nr:metallophosphoesterase [Nanoarchaeota archaeon]MBU0962517.1 metallophosphoesterase [Nanoarchaeota archaeon]